MTRLWQYRWFLFLFGLWGILTPEQGRTATRLGLHFTQEEVWCWRQRASIDAQGTHGITCPVKYKVAGDVSTNSPGDWTRIVAARNTFAANPTNGRWNTPFTSGGCVPASSQTYGWPEASSEGGAGVPVSNLMRDTAFYNLILGVTTDHAILKTELLWIASHNDFAAANPWCFNIIYDSAPAVGVATVINRLLFAYEYMGRAAFTQGELDILDRWFFDAAVYWRHDMDFTLDDKFVNRWAGNYTLTTGCDAPGVDAYVGAPLIYSYPKYYNNRRGGIIRFTTMVGLYLTSVGRNYTTSRYGTQANLVQSGKMFVQEYIRFSLFPEGFVGDFERRGSGGNAEQGWGYSGAALGEIMEMADAFARTGDTSLYTYSTALGACSTAGTINDGGSRQGQNKDVLFALQMFSKYITDQYTRYWPDTSTIDNRLDGRYPRDGSQWHGVHESNLVMANIYFQDSFVTQAYTRTHANSVPYPTNPIAGPPPWQGENALLPGVLFMFGQMEGIVNPYSLGGPSLSPPLNVRIVVP